MRERRKNVVEVMLVSLLFVLAFTVLGQVFFETNDDETLNLICAGAYGPGSRLIYQNIVVGTVVSALFRALPAVNWYLVLMLFCNALSIFALCVVLCERLRTGQRLLVTAAMQLLLGYQFYNQLQYSKNAALYAAVGALLLLRGVKEPGHSQHDRHRDRGDDANKSRRSMRSRHRETLAGSAADRTTGSGTNRAAGSFPGLCLGTLLFVLGFMIRQDSFISVMPAVLCAMLAVVISSAEMSGMLSRLRRLVLRFAPALVLLIVTTLINYGVYRSDHQWRDYLAYNKVRAELTDYGLPDYKSHKAELKELGITKTDLQLLRAWDYMDPEKYSQETLEALVRIRGGNRTSRLRINRTTIHAAAHNMVEAVRNHMLAACAVVFFVAVCFFLDSLGTGMLCLMVLGICAEYWYLSCVGRVVWRGECGVWLAPMILTAGYLAGQYRWANNGVNAVEMGTGIEHKSYVEEAGDRSQREDRKRSGGGVERRRGRNALCVLLRVCPALLLTGIAVFSLLHTFFMEKGGHFTVINNSFFPVLEEIDARAAEQEDAVYMLDTLTFSSRLVAPNAWAMDGSCRGLYAHAGMLGGWEGGSPGGQYYLREQGIDNPIRALAERAHTYLVDQTDAHTLLETYFKEVYDCEVTAVQVDELDGIPVWEFRLGSA